MKYNIHDIHYHVTVVLDLRNFLSVGLGSQGQYTKRSPQNFHSFHKTRPGDRKDIHPISYTDKLQIFISF